MQRTNREEYEKLAHLLKTVWGFEPDREPAKR
jgi:hypothetical protein